MKIHYSRLKVEYFTTHGKRKQRHFGEVKCLVSGEIDDINKNNLTRVAKYFFGDYKKGKEGIQSKAFKVVEILEYIAILGETVPPLN
jgi:hypothetical protein